MSRQAGPARQLAEGIALLGLALPEGVEQGLMRYAELVLHWNRVHNLTAARDAATFVQRHLLDCLAALPWVPESGRLLDIGSGAGLPGLVFALARPRLDCLLVEPRSKRAAFLATARAELGIVSARVSIARVEEMAGPGGFDIATARAVTALAALWGLARPQLGEQGRLLALVGHSDAAEVLAVEATGARVETHRLQVPGLSESRHLVAVRAIA